MQLGDRTECHIRGSSSVIPIPFLVTVLLVCTRVWLLCQDLGPLVVLEQVVGVCPSWRVLEDSSFCFCWISSSLNVAVLMERYRKVAMHRA